MDTKKLRQKILDLAIRGKLVPQDPNDEPASVLVEKIRAEKERLIKEKKIKRDKNESYIYRSDKSYYEKFADGTVKCIDDEIPFDIPERWEWCRLGSISKTILYGVSESAQKLGEYKLLRITDIQNNHVNWANVPFTTIPKDKAADYLLERDDILFARTGATVGKSYLVKNISDNVIYASYLIRVRLFNQIDSDYIKHYFESGFYWVQITDKSVGVGQPNVNGSSLKSLLIPLPSYREQEQISQEAQKLTSLIGAIEDSEGDLSAYIHNAKSKILDLAIRGKLVPQDPNDEPASVLLERIKAEQPAAKKMAPKTRDNSHYENLPWSVPSNWCWCCLSDICSFERGITFPSSAKHTFEQENLLPCIRTANVQEQLELEDLWYIAPSYIRGNVDKLVRNGDIIMSSANSKELVGKTSYVQKIDCDMTFGGFVLNVRAKEIDSKYLFYLLRSYFDKGILMKISTQTTNIANINTVSLGCLQVLLPPLKEQSLIVSKIEQTIEVLNMVAQELSC